MPEFRYHGTGVSGRVVQGVLSARTQGEAKKRAEEICGQQRIKLKNLDRRSTYLYRPSAAAISQFKGSR